MYILQLSHLANAYECMRRLNECHSKSRLDDWFSLGNIHWNYVSYTPVCFTGVQLSWNGRQQRVEVTVPGTYRGRTCGLCGNFNDYPQDDLRLRNSMLASSDAEFGNHWKVRFYAAHGLFQLQFEPASDVCDCGCVSSLPVVTVHMYLITFARKSDERWT